MGCSCHENDPLIPEVAVIKEMREDTHDVITFKLIDKEGNRPFDFLPGQCAMLSVPMIGEAIFSITSSPTEKNHIECSIKRCGKVTDYLHELEVGDEIGVRGPYGNNFPVEKIKNTDLLFIAGGIGLAPLRSVINYVIDNRSDYGLVDIVYGARTPNDLVHPKDIFEIWPKELNTKVHLTVDIEHPEWSGAVGYVPTFVEALAFDINKTVLICGPPIMIKYTLQVLEEIGFKKEQIYTTLELKMKCGIGKCGRCNIGDKYVCKDGPVFRCDEITELPNEY